MTCAVLSELNEKKTALKLIKAFAYSTICAATETTEPFLMPDLPPIVQTYIEASNAHDVTSILACFAKDAVVRDENATHRGKVDIELWITTTIGKYGFQFKPLSAEDRENKSIVAVQISGTFPGSPVTLDYHFAITNDKIASLTIDS